MGLWSGETREYGCVDENIWGYGEEKRENMDVWTRIYGVVGWRNERIWVCGREYMGLWRGERVYGDVESRECRRLSGQESLVWGLEDGRGGDGWT